MTQTPSPLVDNTGDELLYLRALVALQRELIEVQRSVIEAGLERRRVKWRRWSGVGDKNV